MLGKRITEAREYISLFDPALNEASAMERAKYAQTRDVADLGEWKTWPTAPTVFKLKPLEAGYGHLADDMGFLARRTLFMFHVTGVEGMDGLGKQAFEKLPDGQTAMTPDALDLFPEKVVDEIAAVIVEIAGSDTLGFTLPDTYREYLRNSLTRRAILARSTDTASESDSD